MFTQRVNTIEFISTKNLEVDELKNITLKRTLVLIVASLLSVSIISCQNISSTTPTSSSTSSTSTSTTDYTTSLETTLPSTTDITTTVTIPDDNPLKDNLTKLEFFDYGEVTMLEGIFKDSYDSSMAYYMGIPVDDILYGWRAALGLDTKTGVDQGINGNVLGQWISGFSRYYAAVGGPEITEKLNDLTAGLMEISILRPMIDGSLTNMYGFEKYLTGCLDLFHYGQKPEGLIMADRMMAAAMQSSIYTSPIKSLGDNGPGYEIEWYTLGEALLYYVNTIKQEKYPISSVREATDFAMIYVYPEFWDIFYQDLNIFDYNPETGQNIDFFHAYSHLNCYNSAAAYYRQTQDEYYLTSMIRFFDFMRSSQELVTGGFGPRTEWFLPEEEIIVSLQTRHDNYENQCDTYATYKLTDYLMRFTGDASYGNWAEKLLYNSTIASIEIEDGFAFYYSDYNSEFGMKTLRTDWKWSCCAGSRMQNINQVLKNIYYHDTENLYVNLFVNSSVDFERPDNTVTLTQNSLFPYEDTVAVTLNMDQADTFSLKFRQPEWLSGDVIIQVNDEVIPSAYLLNNWLTVHREWQDGDVLEITMPMGFTTNVFEHQFDYGPDGVWAINYGPITMACENNDNIYSFHPVDYLDINTALTDQLIPSETPLHFLLVNDEDETIIYKPFLEFEKHQIYYMYLNLYQYSIFD